MKNFLCIVISITLLLCLCGCGKQDNSSESAKVVYEEEVVYQDEDSTIISDDTSSKEDKTEDENEDDSSQTYTSDESKTDDSSEEEEDGENVFYLNDDQVLKNIKLNGRCEKTSDGIGLNFAASAIEFNTDSSSVVLEVDADSGVYYSVFVDGELKIERDQTTSGKNYIIIARNLNPGGHNIKFVRATEGRAGNMMTATGIQLDYGKSFVSGFSVQSDVVIEFLGDSMSSGYGNLANSGITKASDLKYQDSLKAYPYLIAQKLGFDYRIVSMSGIALKQRGNYPTFYDFYSLENYYKDKSQKYTSSNPQDVDIVVVNLGTNDTSQQLYVQSDPNSVAEYATTYTELITNIGYRADVKIVFVSGIMWCHAQADAYNAAKIKLGELGYNNVYVYDCATYNSGGENHPSEDDHKKVTDAITKFFKENGIV